MSIALQALRVMADVKTLSATRILLENNSICAAAITLTIADEQVLFVILSKLEAQTTDCLSVELKNAQLSLISRVLHGKGYRNTHNGSVLTIQLPLVVEDYRIDTELLTLSEVTKHSAGLRLAGSLYVSRESTIAICEANAADHELLVAIRVGLSNHCSLFSDEVLKKHGLRFAFPYQSVGFERVQRLLQMRGHTVTLYPPRLIAILCFRTMQNVSVVEYDKKVIFKIECT